MAQHPDDRLPILVGSGDVTDSTTPIEVGRSPFDLISQASQLALADAGAPALGEAIDTLAMLRLFSDTSPRFSTKLGGSRNPPRSISQRLGIVRPPCLYVRRRKHAAISGEPVRRGNSTWRDASGTDRRRRGAAHAISRRTCGALGRPLGTKTPGGEPEFFGDERRGWSDHEELYGMRMAIAMYPLIENAIRGDRNRSVSEHLQDMGRLFARFAAVAAENPLATRRENYSAERLATIDAQNRWVGFPYPRLMNANAYIDQAAAIVISSVGTARELGHTGREMGFSPWLRGWQRSLVSLGTREARSLTRNAQRSATRTRDGTEIARRDRDFRHLFLLSLCRRNRV